MPNTIITGTGSYIPENVIPSAYFLKHEFYNKDGTRVEKSNKEVIAKLEEISGVLERRYASDNESTSDMAYKAAVEAIENVNPEEIDLIIVAHNFGNDGDMVPSLASRVKQSLGIANPYCTAYDIVFGCPGWLQGIINAHYAIKSGDAKKALVIGAEKMSVVVDPHDKDQMLFADGAGATLLEADYTRQRAGIISCVSRTDSCNLISKRNSNNPGLEGNFMKMDGHEVYKYVIRAVPEVVKKSLDKVNLLIKDIKKVLIHQANEKMEEAILKKLFRLYAIKEIPENIMPVTISKLGNSSVATIPTTLDLIMRGKLDNHQLEKQDLIVLASVGAGMNINSVVYKV